MKKARILLADDHVLVAEGLRTMLAAVYDVVGTVSDGRSLLDAAETLKPDLIVVDIGMPLSQWDRCDQDAHTAFTQRQGDHSHP